MGGGPQVPVPALAPGQQTEISLRMRSPEAAGIYESAGECRVRPRGVSATPFGSF